MSGVLNQFTGLSNATLELRLKREMCALGKVLGDPDAGGSGSPLEGLYERIGDLKDEIARRSAIPHDAETGE